MANVNPPQPGPQLGPQPNFALLTQGLQQSTQGLQQTTQGLQQATTELGNFANLPPFAQGNALIQQMGQMLRQMQQDIQGQIQQTNQQTLDTIRNEIRALRNDLRITHRATEYNSIARLQNSAARTANHPLTPLRDYTTNVDIPGFPATPALLANISGTAIDPILRALDLPVQGNLSVRRQRLKFYIGLGEMP